jgi:hypothetical protein
MLGSFNEEALEKYAEKAAEKAGVSFSEGDLYDFTRCVRPDGSAYGTGGSCRKGTEGEKEQKEKQVKKKLTDSEKLDNVTEKAISSAENNASWSNEFHAAVLAERLELADEGDDSSGAGLFLGVDAGWGLKDAIQEKMPKASEEDVDRAIQNAIYTRAGKVNPKKVTGDQLADMYDKEHAGFDPDLLAESAARAGVSKKAIREAMEMIEE